MEVIIQPNSLEASKLGASIVATLIRKKADAVLGLATGSSPIGLYRELIRLRREDGLDFSQVTTFNLDEYIGLPPEHPASYHYFMEEQLFSHINVQRKNIHIPDGMTTDIRGFCDQYEQSIRAAGGIDLQILGIGHDGHIGFNEPSSSLASRTRIKTLTEETIQANKRFFSSVEMIPRHVITMGVGTIMDARICLLMAFGEEKAEAVAALCEGPITAMHPASILQMHQQTIVIVDEAAASRLARADYYRHVNAHKPKFQEICAFIG